MAAVRPAWLGRSRLSLKRRGWPHVFAGWSGLGRFWLGVLAILGIGAGVIQTLGSGSAGRSSSEHPAAQAAARSEPETAAKPAVVVAVPHVRTEPVSAELQRPGRGVPGPIHDPDPALMQPNPREAQTFLPRISPDGRAPMHEYAAGFDTSTQRARVGVLVAGIGMNEADSAAAIRLLPAAVSLAVSPYATNIDRLLASARVAEHEYLLSIPMEPQGFPANDPDDRRALMTSLPPSENLSRLYWAMSRFAGYVGATNGLGQLRGERLSDMTEQFDPILQDVAVRGLLFVDARPGQPALPVTWNRSVDLVIDDDPAAEAMLDQRLEALAKLAKDKGSALGLVTVPRPVTLNRVAAWTNTLRDRGLALAPVSALVAPPAVQEQDK